MLPVIFSVCNFHLFYNFSPSTVSIIKKSGFLKEKNRKSEKINDFFQAEEKMQGKRSRTKHDRLYEGLGEEVIIS